MRGIALGLSAGLVVGAVGLTLLSSQAQDAGTVGSADVWVTYKGDSQRTGLSKARLPLPLNLVWRHSMDKGPGRVTMSPLVLGPAGQRRLYYGAGKSVYCLDGQTGAEIWHSKGLSGLLSAPLAVFGGDAGTNIIALTSSGQLTALHASDGEIAWQVETRGQILGAGPILINTAKGPRIVVASAVGRLTAYNLEGGADPDWDVKLGRNGSQPNATPALSADGKTMFIPTADQQVYVVDVTRPAVAFTIRTGNASYTSPVTTRDQVILCAGSMIGSYDQTNAVPLWRRNLGPNNAEIIASPAVGNGMVYVGARNGYFYALGADNGQVAWKVNLDASVTGSPTVLQDAILVGTRSGLRNTGGELFALAPQDGKILWRYRLENDVVTVEDTTLGGPTEGGPFEGGSSSGDSSGYAGSSSGGYGGSSSGYGGSSSGYGGSSSGGYSGGGQGYPGGEGMAGGAPPLTRQVSITYGISSPPAVVDGQVFVLADHGALYDFDSTPFDPEPPRAVTPSLTVKTQQNETRPFLLDDKFPAIPGRAPLYFAAQITDGGSGVDPTSVQATFDNQPLAADAVRYNAPRGVLSLTLLAPAKNGAAASLPEGTHTIGIAARDYRGNAMNYSGTFIVDPKASAPSYIPPDTPETGDGGYSGSSGGYGGSSSGGYGGSSSGGGRRGRRGRGGGSSSSGDSGGSSSGGDSSGGYGRRRRGGGS